MSLKRSVSINLGGQELNLRTTCSDAVLTEILSYVEDKFNKSFSSVKSKSPDKAAILTALNIAEENFLLRENCILELTSIENKAKSILATLKP